MEKKSISNYATCLMVNCYNISIKGEKQSWEGHYHYLYVTSFSKYFSMHKMTQKII